MEICKTVSPEMREVEPGHFCACHLYDPDLDKTAISPDTAKTEEKPADKTPDKEIAIEKETAGKESAKEKPADDPSKKDNGKSKGKKK